MGNETTFNNFLCGSNLSHGSLFSGIGGFEKGADKAGIKTLWNCEFEKRNREILLKHSPALLIRGFERVLLDLSEIGYDAEWQCISNATFGYPHKRERVYIIAYPNEIRLQGDIWESGSTNSIFKQWTPNSLNGYTLSKRIYETPTSDAVRNGDGFRDWTHRVGSLGNAVNPTITYYLFECIKGREKKLLKVETKCSIEAQK